MGPLLPIIDRSNLGCARSRSGWSTLHHTIIAPGPRRGGSRQAGRWQSTLWAAPLNLKQSRTHGGGRLPRASSACSGELYKPSVERPDCKLLSWICLSTALPGMLAVANSDLTLPGAAASVMIWTWILCWMSWGPTGLTSHATDPRRSASPGHFRAWQWRITTNSELGLGDWIWTGRPGKSGVPFGPPIVNSDWNISESIVGLKRTREGRYTAPEKTSHH